VVCLGFSWGYPFSLEYVRPAVERAVGERAQIIVASDELRGMPLLHKIESMMESADLCLFDLTLHNPNVAAEFRTNQKGTRAWECPLRDWRPVRLEG
jgi:hypothetical protein